MQDELEAEIRGRCAEGAHAAAVTAAIGGYGEEVFSFLLARLRDEDAAADVFAAACEDLLHSLPQFAWRCSARTWFYRLARSAAARHVRSPHHRGDRRVPLSGVSEVAAQVRSRTRAHLRSEVKDRMRALRERLPPDDQQLLLLRVDRDLAWGDIAQILDDDDDPAAQQRTAARLRQQFQALKARLRELAIAEGLLEPE